MKPGDDAATLLERLRDPSIPLDARIEAAHALADLGDPRLDDPAIIAFPKGVLHRKSSPTAAVEEVAMHAFGIDRYPVTVAAFEAFIDADGYDDPSFWSPEGWAWRLDEDIDAPRFWDEDDEWGAYLVPNHPVVGVSGYEAEAYAAFRGARLPTINEWERACRGDDARDYPWGDTWRHDICAHREHGPRCTSPIGVFPESTSAYGVDDLVGCVWQWTSDWRGSDANTWVVCGGAWNNKPWSLGAHGRNAYPARARFSNLGFRCVHDAD